MHSDQSDKPTCCHCVCSKQTWIVLLRLRQATLQQACGSRQSPSRQVAGKALAGAWGDNSEQEQTDRPFCCQSVRRAGQSEEALPFGAHRLSPARLHFCTNTTQDLDLNLQCSLTIWWTCWAMFRKQDVLAPLTTSPSGICVACSC